MHWIRHSTLTWVERNFGYAVARATSTYVRTSLSEVGDGAEGRVWVINGRTDTATSTIGVGQAAAGVAVSPRTGKIYVTNYQADTVSVIG
jgi:DNA-binding beta-propeller fold protein YncE